MSISPPHDTSPDDRELVDYLLQLLPADDIDRLDEASMADDEVAERLRIVEHDLVDAYVRGELTGRQLARFESHYLATPRRREEVAFARRLARAVDRAAAATAAPVRARARPWLVWGLAAAVVFLAAASTGLTIQMLRLGRGLASAEHDHAALEGRARDLDQKLAEARAANAASASEIDRLRDAAGSALTNAGALALVLLPQTRAIGPVPTAALPGGGPVTFELRLESNDFPRYQAALRDPALNRIVWRSAWIEARTSDGRPSIVVSVPASIMKPQHYALELTGRGQDAGDVIASYVFEAVPR